MASTTATVGMVGAGQLARMTHAAAIGLGVRLKVLARSDDDAAAQVDPHAVVGDWGSLADLRAFADGCDVVTFDHELLDPAHLVALSDEGVALAPPPQAKRFAQDKLHQRRGLGAAGLSVPAFVEAGEPADVAAFAEAHGWPAVLKAVRGGYDGRGVWVLGEAVELESAWAGATGSGQLMVEGHVPIATELSVLVARTAAGETAVYPVVETVQRDGICVETLAPARVDPDVAGRAGELGRQVADAVGAVGLCAVEMFVTPAGELVVNELALRPHNSGHWTIEGAVTSQFANHLRAVLGWPLGATDAAGAVATVNLLGPADGSDPAARLPRALVLPEAHVHLYGKGARPGRKLGHVTVVGRDHDAALASARRAAGILRGERQPA